MPQLLDPNFHRTVVLLIHHDDEGCFGVVLNRGSGITARRLCESVELSWAGDPEEEIGWGGPVQPQTGWVLFGDTAGLEPDEDVQSLVPGVHFAGSLGVLEHMAQSPPAALRLLVGYAGWGPGQLENELAEGAWLLAPADSESVFRVPEEALWEHVLRGLGVEPATLVASRGVH